MNPRPSRRALLSSLALPFPFLAGCGSTRDGSGGARTVAPRLRGTPTRTATPTPTATREPTRTLEPTDSPRSTPVAASPGESKFAGRPCPPTLDGCYHRTTGRTPAFVRPSRERVELGGAVTMALVNRSGGDLFFGPNHWTVWREADDGWTNVDDRTAVSDVGYELPPGESYEWPVRVDADADDGTSNLAAAGVDFRPGLYCFGVREVSLPGGSDRVGTLGALFAVV